MANGSGWTVDRILLGIALLGGLSSAGVGMLGTQDRFYGSQGRELTIRIDYLEKENTQLKQDIRRLDDNHPPQDLLQDVGELRQRVRQLEKQ